MHIYFHILGLDIPGYALMILLGLVIANLIAMRVVVKNHLDSNDFIICEAYVLLGALIGAKLLYLWVARHQINWSLFFRPDYFNALMKGGFVFYGGLIGGLITLYAGGKLHKIPMMSYLQKLIFLIPLVHGFGRIGCYFAGCCYGIPYEGTFAVRFPANSLAPSDVTLFPVQLLEAILLIILAAVVYYASRNEFSNRGIYIYFLGYSIIRFFLEYLRYDEARGQIYGISTSQWISIAIVLGMAAVLVKGIRTKKSE